ncbi:uncharacterized protein EI90DRAFT_198209 [Cantharellus anzutake]|uniref:uncharacterized protein n=1 Tax=Cantharellus anzutake TaxID=1750568 RepID=UPI0019042CB1|nr:uncharacterized protein EI90DRAFT_198209 [Cantharellus anzutake]KAF8336606.1 hypothetical protein EI90DRAFT_198209 [Cantharellus anzutake]
MPHVTTRQWSNGILCTYLLTLTIFSFAAGQVLANLALPIPLNGVNDCQLSGRSKFSLVDRPYSSWVIVPDTPRDIHIAPDAYMGLTTCSLLASSKTCMDVVHGRHRNMVVKICVHKHQSIGNEASDSIILAPDPQPYA